jgi:hemolysin activation/secretion protein
MQLGGVQNLRAFNSRRFTGNAMLYDNIELRIKLFDFSSILFPGSFGIIGFNDLGRVWVDNEKSTQWHHGYGGGIYLAPADIAFLRILVGHSVETTQLYLNLGVSF